jgi:hypothetical protein
MEGQAMETTLLGLRSLPMTLALVEGTALGTTEMALAE